VIKLVLSGGNQTITKVCNHCGCHLDNLEVEDIMVKRPSDLTVKDKDGNEITRTELPESLRVCQCEDCN
jgi:hypothetical protein|tara:strand:+ start:594 stop:800 length:207 start_codon:yes stop_codon:yes gene_type:complete